MTETVWYMFETVLNGLKHIRSCREMFEALFEAVSKLCETVLKLLFLKQFETLLYPNVKFSCNCFENVFKTVWHMMKLFWNGLRHTWRWVRQFLNCFCNLLKHDRNVFDTCECLELFWNITEMYRDRVETFVFEAVGDMFEACWVPCFKLLLETRWNRLRQLGTILKLF